MTSAQPLGTINDLGLTPDEIDSFQPDAARLDVKAHGAIRYAPLREHIARVGVTLYRLEADASIAAKLEELGYGG